MAITKDSAAKLCSAPEFQLFRASQTDLIRGLSKAQLESKIERARSLRDKNQDLFKRQRLETRRRTGTKLGTSKAANKRTEQKAKLFAEVLDRFEKRLAKLAEAEKRAAKLAAAREEAAKKALAAKAAAKKKSTGSAKPPAVKKRAAAKAKTATKRAARRKTKTKTGFMTRKAAAAARKKNLQNTRAKGKQGHVRARGKRNQAKRDSR